MEKNVFLNVTGILMIIFGIGSFIYTLLFLFAAELLLILLTAITFYDFITGTEALWYIFGGLSAVNSIAFVVTGVISIMQRSPKRCLVASITAGAIGLGITVYSGFIGFLPLTILSAILLALNLIAAISFYKQNKDLTTATDA